MYEYSSQAGCWHGYRYVILGLNQLLWKVQVTSAHRLLNSIIKEGTLIYLNLIYLNLLEKTLCEVITQGLII